MGLLDVFRRIFDMKGAAKAAQEHAAAEEEVQAAPSPQTERAPELATGPGQPGSAATGAAVVDPVPSVTRQTDPAVQSASAEQTPEEQRQAAADDPAASSKPGTEGQDQEPR